MTTDITVKARMNLLTNKSLFVIPAGTEGRVIGYRQDKLVIDFGLPHFFMIPRNSKLIEVIGEGK